MKGEFSNLDKDPRGEFLILTHQIFVHFNLFNPKQDKNFFSGIF